MSLHRGGVGNKWGPSSQVTNPTKNWPEMLLEQLKGCKATVTEVFLTSQHPAMGVSGWCSSTEGPRCHQGWHQPSRLHPGPLHHLRLVPSLAYKPGAVRQRDPLPRTVGMSDPFSQWDEGEGGWGQKDRPSSLQTARGMHRDESLGSGREAHGLGHVI